MHFDYKNKIKLMFQKCIWNLFMACIFCIPSSSVSQVLTCSWRSPCILYNEIHFITKCPIYTKEREIFYNKVTTDQINFSNLNPKENFVYILTHYSCLLVNFFIASWRIRSDLLYENTKSWYWAFNGLSSDIKFYCIWNVLKQKAEFQYLKL